MPHIIDCIVKLSYVQILRCNWRREKSLPFPRNRITVFWLFIAWPPFVNLCTESIARNSINTSKCEFAINKIQELSLYRGGITLFVFLQKYE
jgi:hypothetical protein